MAGTEGVSGSSSQDETLSTRLQWLKERREALQEKLAQKNNELKNLCVEEAELTGILPPEIPLEPGESPPTFRRRVGTAFAYPQNLINKLKSNEAEESALELERQVQVGITEAAMAIFNDPLESKAVRRKHRLVYQQSQRRLQELDTQLSILRQSRGKSHRPTNLASMSYSAQAAHLQTRHRTKKPRPPQENPATTTATVKTRSILQEGGISLSPLGTERNCNTFPSMNSQWSRSSCLEPGRSPDSQRDKFVEHDFNDNHNVYILPDQYRSRTYSHGSGGSGRNHSSFGSDTIERSSTCRPVPNTYTEEERQLRYRQMQYQRDQELLQNHRSYPEFRQLDNEFPTSHRRISQNQVYYDPEPFEYPSQQWYPAKSHTAVPRRDDKRRNVPPAVLENHLPFWNAPQVDTTENDRFGSLDRRKHAQGVEIVQPRHHTVVLPPKNSLIRQQQQLHQQQQQLQLRTSPLTDRGSSSSSNQTLLRTQSLGSVETWHPVQESVDDAKDVIDNGKREKEKEWYETSVDSGTNSRLSQSVQMKQQNSRRRDIPEEYVFANQSRFVHQQPKVIEIPAESKRDDTEVCLNSPTNSNCTIVQPGKYQPYREVTKPFEMSDFYKYSTKYRKRVTEAATSAGTHATGSVETRNDVPVIPGCSDGVGQQPPVQNVPIEQSGSVATSPVQKRIYQPVQRMTCQPYIGALR